LLIPCCCKRSTINSRIRVELSPIFTERRQLDCVGERDDLSEPSIKGRFAERMRVLLLAADTTGLRIIPIPSSLAASRLICPSRKCGLNVKNFFVIKTETANCESSVELILFRHGGLDPNPKE